MIHSEHQRRAYLEAMGVDVWIPRGEAEHEAPANIERHDVGTHSMDWGDLRECVSSCVRCELSKSRTQTVFGVGNQNADWLLIGEAPGAEEDRRGEPFVGRAGTLLNEMLRSIGQSRESVFIANILKCRPPNNRDPKPAEAAACRAYLERQIELIQPKIILVVGRIAAQTLLECDDPVGRIRDQQYKRPHQLGSVPLVVTYHPAYLLRSPSQKPKSWSDLCLATRLISELQT